MFQSARSKQDERRKAFKQGIDASDSRRRREEQHTIIRKNKREELALKRRNITLQDASSELILPWPEDLQPLVQSLHSNDLKLVFESAQSFRKILSGESNPPIDRVIASGIIPRLVQLLGVNGEREIQLEAAWALTNIASGTSEHTKLVVSSGAVTAFILMLASPHEENREQAIWALGNIAGDSPHFRDFVLSCGILPPLLHLLTNPASKSFLRNATWTLSNLVRGKPAPDFETVRPCLQALTHLVRVRDEEVLGDACWALSYLSDGESPRIQAIVDAGLLAPVIKLLHSDNESVMTPSLRTIGNILTGSAEQTQAALNAGALGGVMEILINCQQRSVVKECCWALSNVTAGTSSQIGEVLKGGFCPLLHQYLSDSPFEVRKEVTYVITNAISGGSDAQIRYLVETEHFLDPMVSLLEKHDPNIVLLCLEAITKILSVGDKCTGSSTDECNPYALILEANGGLEAIENLQNHAHSRVHQLAAKILDDYFDGEDENTLDNVLAAEAAPVLQKSNIFGQASSFGFANPPSTGFSF